MNINGRVIGGVWGRVGEEASSRMGWLRNAGGGGRKGSNERNFIEELMTSTFFS